MSRNLIEGDDVSFGEETITTAPPLDPGVIPIGGVKCGPSIDTNEGCHWAHREEWYRDASLLPMPFQCPATTTSNADRIPRQHCVPNVLFSKEDITSQVATMGDRWRKTYDKFTVQHSMGDRAKYLSSPGFISGTGVDGTRMCPSPDMRDRLTADFMDFTLLSGCAAVVSPVCDEVHPNPPAGYDYVGSSQDETQFLGDGSGSGPYGYGCQYKYVKDWDHVRWGAPPKYDPDYSSLALQGTREDPPPTTMSKLMLMTESAASFNARQVSEIDQRNVAYDAAYDTEVASATADATAVAGRTMTLAANDYRILYARRLARDAENTIIYDQITNENESLKDTQISLGSVAEITTAGVCRNTNFDNLRAGLGSPRPRPRPGPRSDGSWGMIHPRTPAEEESERETCIATTDSAWDTEEKLAHFNHNGIPLTRMKCCIGSTALIGLEEYDFLKEVDINNCPIYLDPSNEAILHSYTPDSDMCSGVITDSALSEKTPEGWCTFGILKDQSNFDIANFDIYWNLLNDKLCTKWIENDESSPTDPRKMVIGTMLTPFFIWISSQLIDRSINPSTPRVALLGSDYIELNANNRTDLSDMSADPNGYTFDISNDYGKYLNLLMTPHCKYFLRHGGGSDVDNFNRYMSIFSNRYDIFNFHVNDTPANRGYNKLIEDKYSKLCSCYWDKEKRNTPPNYLQNIYSILASLREDDSDVISSNAARVFDYTSTIDPTNDPNFKNQCWFGNCITNDHLSEPYRDTNCPNICISTCYSEAVFSNQGQVIDSAVNVQADNDCKQSCENSPNQPPPGTSYSSTSDLDLSESLALLNPGDSPGSDSGSGSGSESGSGSGSDSSKNIITIIAVIMLLIFIGGPILYGLYRLFKFLTVE